MDFQGRFFASNMDPTLGTIDNQTMSGYVKMFLQISFHG